MKRGEGEVFSKFGVGSTEHYLPVTVPQLRLQAVFQKVQALKAGVSARLSHLTL